MKRILLTAIGAFCLHGALMAQTNLKPVKSQKRHVAQIDQVNQEELIKQKQAHIESLKTWKKSAQPASTTSAAKKAEIAASEAIKARQDRDENVISKN